MEEERKGKVCGSGKKIREDDREDRRGGVRERYRKRGRDRKI